MEWTIKYYLLSLAALLIGTLIILVTVLVLEKLKLLPGAARPRPFQLAGGTGKYRLTIPSTAAINYLLALSPGKLVKLTETTQ